MICKCVRWHQADVGVDSFLSFSILHLRNSLFLLLQMNTNQQKFTAKNKKSYYGIQIRFPNLWLLPLSTFASFASLLCPAHNGQISLADDWVINQTFRFWQLESTFCRNESGVVLGSTEPCSFFPFQSAHFFMCHHFPLGTELIMWRNKCTICSGIISGNWWQTVRKRPSVFVFSVICTTSLPAETHSLICACILSQEINWLIFMLFTHKRVLAKVDSRFLSCIANHEFNLSPSQDWDILIDFCYLLIFLTRIKSILCLESFRKVVHTFLLDGNRFEYAFTRICSKLISNLHTLVSHSACQSKSTFEKWNWKS